ncbi:PAS domain S-box protein [Nocardioides sp.]|uniref:PAS domain S-box protein n=1 Tax=Nocardioides sp. TaxID=35761 RepID=UPI00356A3CA5
MSSESTHRPSRAEAASLDALEYLRDAGSRPLMNSFPHGAVFAFDADLRYLSAGGSGLAAIGFSREMLEGKTLFEVFPEETAKLIEPSYRAALAGTPTIRDVPYAGRIFTQRLAPVTDDTGRIVAGLGFAHDVTAALAAENALRESEERNRLTFEHAPIGQALIELDGRWRQVNAAVVELTGYSEQQLLQMTFQDITHPDDLDLDIDHLNQLVAGEINSYQIEKRYFTASGLIVWVLLSVALVHDEDGAPLYFISQIQDITERKRQQQTLQDLTAMLAHDLRTPAAVIGGFAELLTGSLASDEDQVRAAAGRIAAAGRTLTHLLDNALTASTLDAGKLKPAPRAVSVPAAVIETLATLELGSANVDTTDLQECTAWVDPVHLSQITANLLTNAAKYGGDQIRVASAASGDRVQLSVTDNGPGVEPDFVPYLFDRFSRSSNARTGQKRGSGLGLYIVQDLLSANGGAIHYCADADGGASFVVELLTSPEASSPSST